MLGAESLGSKMMSVLLDGLPYLGFPCADVLLCVYLTVEKFNSFICGLNLFRLSEVLVKRCGKP